MDEIISSLITDRTDADIGYYLTLRSKVMAGTATSDEIEEFWAGLKGAYNASDLNRVNAAVTYLSQEAKDILTDIAAYLAAHGVSMDPVFQPYDPSAANVSLPVIDGTRTTWERPDIPTPEQAAQYLANVTTLKALLPLPADTPNVPSDLQNFLWNEANDIEEILVIVNQALLDWQENAEQQIDYIGNYNYQLISGTFYSGNNRTLQHFSRGR